jgi:hypothetical protein
MKKSRKKFILAELWKRRDEEMMPQKSYTRMVVDLLEV